MAKLPVLQRQQLLQGTTGQQRFRPAQTIDPVSEAIGQAGQIATDISDKMWLADSKVQLSAANTNTQMELASLQVELAKGNSETALRDYQVRAQEIYARNAEGMSPLVVAEYDSAFATINAKTNLSLTSTIAAKRSDERVGHTYSVLDWGVTHGAVSADPQVRASALAQGLSEIAARVDANDITPDKAKKMALEYRADFMDAVMVGRVNNFKLGDLSLAYEQMRTGEFGDEEVNLAWSTLTGKRQAQLLSQVITNNSRYLSAKDADERRAERKREAQVLQALKDFWGANTTDDKRAEAADILRRNPETSVADLREVENALSGRSADLDDPVAVVTMEDRIAQFPGDITEAEIRDMPFGFETRDALVEKLRNMGEILFNRASQYVNTSPQFVFPSEMARSLAAGLQGAEALESSRRQVMTELHEARSDARLKGEPFDAMIWVRERLDPERGAATGADAVNEREGNAIKVLEGYGIGNEAEWQAAVGEATRASETNPLAKSRLSVLMKNGTLAGYTWGVTAQ